MKKTLIIWGAALILMVAAIIVTNGYGNGKSNAIFSDDPNITTQDKNRSEDKPAEDFTVTKALDFTLTDLDGNTVSLSDYKGKNVYLNFFATWCPPCRDEMPDIENMYQKYKDQGLVVLAINLGEDQDTVKSFMEDNGYNFSVLLDSDQNVGQLYEISAIPVSVFIDKNGNVVEKRVGALTAGELEEYIKILLNKK